jgi:PAS domain-containing protein
VLEVPLKWKGKTIGVLYMEDEVGRKFTAEDAHLLALFADQAAIALVNSDLVAKDTEMVEELSNQKDFLERLIDSSPSGVIVVDATGTIVVFNKQAEDILGYKAEELLNTPSAPIYYDPREARKIVRLLHDTPSGTKLHSEAGTGRRSPFVFPPPG